MAFLFFLSFLEENVHKVNVDKQMMEQYYINVKRLKMLLHCCTEKWRSVFEGKVHYQPLLDEWNHDFRVYVI